MTKFVYTKTLEAFPPDAVPKQLQELLIHRAELNYDPTFTTDSLVDFVESELIGTGVRLVTDRDEKGTGPYWSVYVQGEGVSLTLVVDDFKKFGEHVGLPERTISILTAIEECCGLNLRSRARTSFGSCSTEPGNAHCWHPSDIPGINGFREKDYTEAIEALEDYWKDFVRDISTSALTLAQEDSDYLTSWDRIQEDLKSRGVFVDAEGNEVDESEVTEVKEN
jgi:hypothetical protein